MSSWAERTWLITGGSSGIGRALAEGVLQRGGRVAVTARDASQIDMDLRGRGVAVSLDFTCPETIPIAIEEVATRLGPVDVLINNAGYGLLGAVEETGDDERRAQFEANFFGPTWLTTLLLPGLRSREATVIVNISSVSAVIGPAGSAYYAASKSAFESWSDCLAAEVWPFGVRVMIVEPGGFRTNFFGRSRHHTEKQLDLYETVDQRRSTDAANAQSASGDPDRGAIAIINALDCDVMPRRLPLGTQAAKIIEEVLRTRIDEIDSVRDISVSADYVDN